MILEKFLCNFRSLVTLNTPVSGDQPMERGNRIGPGAFEGLVRENLAWVRGYFRSRLRDWASADDLAQDVFVTAYLKLKNFRGESTFEIWLRGIARNHLRNFLRKHREEALGGSDELQALLDRSCDRWEETESTNGRLQALRDCLERLPEQAKKLLEKRYIQGCSVREISKETGKGYSALAMQLHRMREQLAVCIQRQTLHDET